MIKLNILSGPTVLVRKDHIHKCYDKGTYRRLLFYGPEEDLNVTETLEELQELINEGNKATWGKE